MRWFKHDSSAHRDLKLKKVKRKYGITGYGLYWYCLELIADSVDKKNITFELEDDSEEIAHEWNLDRVTVSEIMEYMVNLGLFECSDNRITCMKMATRLDDTNSRNPQIQAIIRELECRSSAKTSDIPEDSSEDPENSSARLDKIRLDETRLEKNSSSDSQANTSTVSAKITKKQQESIIELYHEMLPELSTVLVNRWHGSKHATALANRWKEDPQFRSKTFWTKFFNTVRQNSWWMGVPDPASQQSWKKCNLAWLVNRTNFDKVMQLGNDLSRDQ